MKKSLLDMDEISVRDLNSARIVEKIVGKKPEVVLDPTYLWDFTKDSNVIKPQYEDYMVVYGQDGMDEISLSAPTTVCEVRNGSFK